jgi:hypothetical protein
MVCQFYPPIQAGVLVVIVQEAAKPIATPHTPFPTCLRDPREQQQPWMTSTGIPK